MRPLAGSDHQERDANEPHAVHAEADGPRMLILMGVSGAGKTTIGLRLARALGWSFVEGDDHHPPQNIAKMASGVPLSDKDRAPWLDRIAQRIAQECSAGRSAVFTCSALKRKYRDRLAAASGGVCFVYLAADRETLAARLAERTAHFMPPGLLESQLDALEEPDADEPALYFDARGESALDTLIAMLRDRGLVQ